MRQVQTEYFSWFRPAEPDVYAWQRSIAFLPIMDNQITVDQRVLHAEKKFLVARDPGTPRFLRYDPLEMPDLFAKFAAIEPTPEAFASFANEYGALGVDVMLAVEVEGSKGKSFVSSGFGEPLYRWRDAHDTLKRVSELVLAIAAGDVERLRPWIKIWDTGARYEYEVTASGYRAWALICETRHGHRTDLWKWANDAKSDDLKLIRLASGYAQEVVNKALSGEPTDHTMSSSRLLFDVEKKAIAMFLVPNSLLAAMWLQCAKSLALGQDLKMCEHCGRAFPVAGKDGRRRDSRYCSNSCKVAAHRARKATASSTAPQPPS